MSIAINDDEVILTEDEYTFEDIYTYADSINSSVVSKLGGSYKIDVELTLKDNARLIGKNNYIEVLGEYITITKGCTLQLGEKNSNGQTINGCYLYAPNLSNKYGFGNLSYNESGNILLYNSTVDAWCFWSFFNGENIVEIIDCKINGFGRVSGENSIVYNVEFKKANGRYGFLAVLGTIGIYDKLVVKKSVKVKDKLVCAYHNPKYSKNMTISNSILDGYDKIVYIEDTSGGDTLEFLDCDIRGNLEPYRETNNVDMRVVYTFNPIVTDPNNELMTGINIEIFNNENTSVFTGDTDEKGAITARLLHHLNDRDGNISNYNPHKIVITKSEDEVMKFKLNIDKPLIETPITFALGGAVEEDDEGVDYDKIKNIITERMDTMAADMATLLQPIGLDIGDVKEIANSNSERLDDKCEKFEILL